MSISVHVYVYIDHVRILCLSCNVKKPKTTAKLSKKCSRFLASGNMNQVPESWSVILYNEQKFSQCNLIARIEPMKDKYVYSFLLKWFIFSLKVTV